MYFEPLAIGTVFLLCALQAFAFTTVGQVNSDIVVLDNSVKNLIRQSTTIKVASSRKLFWQQT